MNGECVMSGAKPVRHAWRRAHLHASCSSGVISSALASMSMTGTCRTVVLHLMQQTPAYDPGPAQHWVDYDYSRKCMESDKTALRNHA